MALKLEENSHEKLGALDQDYYLYLIYKWMSKNI